MTVSRTAAILAFITIFVARVTPAAAQDERFRVSFTPAAATGGDSTDLALAGSFGYRFADRLWFEGDLTWIDGPTPDYDPRILQSGNLDAARELFGRDWSRLAARAGRAGASLPTLSLLIAPTDHETLIGTVGLRYELPGQTDRFRPYVAGGLGINRTEQEFRFDSSPFADRFDESISHTGVAFNAGLGASVRLFNRLYGDVDARYFRLSRERNVMRLGGGVSVRF